MPTQYHKYLFMDILHKSEKEIREMGFFDYIRGLAYSTAAFHSRRIDLLIRAFSGKPRRGDINEPSINYNRKDFGVDPSYTTERNEKRRERIKELREKAKQNKFIIDGKEIK